MPLTDLLVFDHDGEMWVRPLKASLGLTDEARLGAVVVLRRIVVMGIVVVMVSVQIQHRHRHIVVVLVRHNRVGKQKDIGQ